MKCRHMTGWVDILFRSYTLVTLTTPVLAVSVGEHLVLTKHSSRVLSKGILNFLLPNVEPDFH